MERGQAIGFLLGPRLPTKYRPLVTLTMIAMSVRIGHGLQTHVSPTVNVLYEPQLHLRRRTTWCVCVCIEEKLCVWSTDAWSSLTCAGRSTGDVVNQSLMDEMKCGRAKVQGKLRAGAAE